MKHPHAEAMCLYAEDAEQHFAALQELHSQDPTMLTDEAKS